MAQARAATGQRKSLLMYALAYAGGASLQKGVGFLLFMWLAHALTVQQYARFGLLYALQTGIAALAVAGITESVVGMLGSHRDAGARRALFAGANRVFVVLAAGAALLALAVYLGWAGTIGASAGDLLCVAVAGIASAFFTLQSLLTRLEENHPASLLLNVLPPLAGLLAAALAFMLVPSVSAFFAGMVGGLLLALLSLNGAGFAFAGFDGRAEARGIAQRLAPYVLIVALAWLSGYGNTYLVQSFFDATEVARFTFAYTLSSVMQLLATSLNQVWSPTFFRVVHEQPCAEVERSNRRFYTFQGAVLGGIGALVLVAVPFAVRLVGPSLAPYTDLEAPLGLLFAAYALSIPWWHVQNYYMAHSRGPELMVVVLAASVAGLLAWLAAIWLFGSIGVYLGFAAMMALRSVGAFVRARQLWPLRLMWEGTLLALLLLGAGTLLALQLRQG